MVLAETSTKAMAAVRDLVYKGTCYLDEVASSCLRYGTFTSQIHLHQLILPEILETLGVLGIEVSSDSFSSNTENAEAVRGFCSGISTLFYPMCFMIQ